MTDEELIEAITQDRKDNCGVDEACVRRLLNYAKEYGQSGRAAASLIREAAAMLEIEL